MINGNALENLEVLDDLLVRLKAAGFNVEVDQVPGSAMKFFGLKEIRQSYVRAYNKNPKNFAAWDADREKEAREVISGQIDENKQ
jgi:hypothetical protein